MTSNDQRWILAVVVLAEAVQVARVQVLVVLARPVLRVLPVLRQPAVEAVAVVVVVVAVIHIRKSGFS